MMTDDASFDSKSSEEGLRFCKCPTLLGHCPAASLPSFTFQKAKTKQKHANSSSYPPEVKEEEDDNTIAAKTTTASSTPHAPHAHVPIGNNNFNILDSSNRRYDVTRSIATNKK